MIHFLIKSCKPTNFASNYFFDESWSTSARQIMEHRDKRPRLDNEKVLASTLEANAPSTEPSFVTAAMGDESIATASSAPTAASESVQDVSISLTSDPAGTPDKATWQGWAEIENDPVWLCP
jgi:hypothetical protein